MSGKNARKEEKKKRQKRNKRHTGRGRQASTQTGRQRGVVEEKKEELQF